jgi:hypothetical protein
MGWWRECDLTELKAKHVHRAHKICLKIRKQLNGKK